MEVSPKNTNKGGEIKSRTPSGTNFQFEFRDTRSIFSPERVNNSRFRERSCSLSEISLPSCSQSTVKVAFAQSVRRNSINSVSSIVRAVKNRASAKAISHVSKQKQTVSGAILADQSDSDTEAFHTPPATPCRTVIKKKGVKKSKGPVQSKWQVGVSHFFRNMKGEDQSITHNMETEEHLNTEVQMEEEQTSQINQEKNNIEVDTEIKVTQGNLSAATTIQTQKILDLAATAQQHIPDTDIPAVLDIRTVMKMFKKIQDDKGDEIKKVIEEELQKRPKEDVTKLEQIEEELKWSRKRERIMARTVQRMHDITLELATKIDNLEINNAKRCITIAGFEVRGKKDAIIQQIERFLFDDLGVDAQVEDTYPLNTSSPPTRVVVLTNQKDKHRIMKSKSVLKDYELDQPIYINDFQPSALAERKRWEKELNKICDNLDGDQKSEIQISANHMFVDGAQQDPKVIPPGPEDILDLSEQDLDEILRIKIPSGPKVSQHNSEFKAYIICAENHQQIQQAYCKICWVHAAARHIVCAYNLLNGKSYEKIGFCDDGEVGAGRKILQVLLQNDIEARAVFVVRYYGGIKMGPDRFQCYEEAVKGAVLAHPFNTITRWEQKITPAQSQPSTKEKGQTKQTEVKKSTNTDAHRGRGNARGSRPSRGYRKTIPMSKTCEAAYIMSRITPIRGHAMN